MTLLFTILAHERPYLPELVANVRHFNPGSPIALYNSGNDPNLGDGLGLLHVTPSRPLSYARVAPFFLDTFEWLHNAAASTSNAHIQYDYLINLETDMLFIRTGFQTWLEGAMQHCDYMAANYTTEVNMHSTARYIRTLRPELSQWYDLFGFEHIHIGFSPGMVFSRRYVDRLVGHGQYGRIRAMVEDSRAMSLQEVLLPTLAEYLGLWARGYPKAGREFNRFRPFQTARNVARALTVNDVYFVHPVPRDGGNGARVMIDGL